MFLVKYSNQVEFFFVNKAYWTTQEHSWHLLERRVQETENGRRVKEYRAEERLKEVSYKSWSNLGVVSVRFRIRKVDEQERARYIKHWVKEKTKNRGGRIETKNNTKERKKKPDRKEKKLTEETLVRDDNRDGRREGSLFLDSGVAVGFDGCKSQICIYHGGVSSVPGSWLY